MINRIVARRDFVKMGLLAGATMTTGGLLSACASNGEGAASQSADGLGVGSSSGANQAVRADPATPPQPVGGKVLVAYYSAQGHTRAVAERIAAATGGDIFEITPENPYSDADLDWRDDNSRVTREHDDQSLRDIVLSQVTPDAFEEYETVFVGYPVWWQMAAWPVNRFVRDNDFVRKTVIPFCTSTSSSMGSTRQTLEQLAGSGEWLDGQRFGENPQDGMVEDWVESLNI